jgi:DNA-binding Xre family transcriptional regulator
MKRRVIMVRIKLAELLAEKKWSRADLSRITGIRYNTINDYYTEFALSLKLEHIKLICDALGCSSSDLIYYKPTPKK